jgi:hypothetical protein
MKVISGLLPETWGYFCMKNFISTTRNCHSHIHESTHFILFALLKVHPRFFPCLACGSRGAAPSDPPSQWACLEPLQTIRSWISKHKIYKKQWGTNIRKYSFSQRVVDTWNSFPAKVIESNTVNEFKNQLNTHWKDLEYIWIRPSRW